MKTKKKISPFAVIFIILLMLISVAAIFVFRVLSHKPPMRMHEGREEGKYNFLILGKDNAASLCDIMILMSFDTKTDGIFVLQIPRDTYLRYTEGSYKKINGALSHFGSEQALSDSLGAYFGVPIDFYLSLDTDSFEGLVDALGGIEVDVPTDMRYYDPYQDFSVDLRAGRQMLDGRAALGFVRYRESYLLGDLTRIDAQKIFASALFARMSEQKNPKALYSIYKSVKNGINTNLSEDDMLYFGAHLLSVSKENVTMLTLPGEAVQSDISGAWYYVLSKEATGEVLKNNFSLLTEQKDFDKNKNFVDIKTKSFYDIYNKFCKYTPRRMDEIGREGIELT